MAGLKGVPTSPEQVADGGHVDLVGFLPAHQLLLTVLLDGKAIDEDHWLGALQQMAGQVFEVMTGRFHADQHELGVGARPGLINGLTQLIEPALEDVDLESWCHNLT